MIAGTVVIARRGASVAIALLLLLASAAAYAEREEDVSYTRDSAWVGFGGALAREHFDRSGSYDDGGAIAFRAGLRGYGFVGAEFVGEVLPGFDGRGATKDLDGFTVSANLKLFLPLGRLEPYASAGIGFLSIDRDNRGREDDFAFRFAAGGDFYLTPHWAVYGEATYLLPTGDVSRYDYSTYGGGILYRF